MVCKIIWLPRALKTYISNIQYLEANWTKKEIENFKVLVDKKIENISHHPKLGSARSKDTPHIRFTLIHKRVALIYKYKPSRNEIELMVFWNTYQNPRKIKLK
jgi:plasmid stabilization system protein ParE